MTERTCSQCGGLGHYGSREKGCSPTYRAAQLVLDGKATITQAAARLRVPKQSVSRWLIRNGHRTYKPQKVD